MTKEGYSFKRPSDSFFTHIFARSISVHITPVVAKTPATPLQVTFIGLIIGLFAAYTGSCSGWVYGIFTAFLIELSHVLDCVDGELARLTDRGNPFAASFDPISDRIKDIAILYAAFKQSTRANIFHLTESDLFSITFIALCAWFLYMYIVDAFLNPVRKEKLKGRTKNEKRIYIGLYDVFIYGSIFLWLFNLAEYFIFLILIFAVTGCIVQLVRLKKYLSLY